MYRQPYYLHITVVTNCKMCPDVVARRARVFYEPRVATLCDICEGEDCSTSCSSKPYSHSHEKYPSTATRVLLSSIYVVLSVLFLQGWVS
jgi:hypothetical protein